MSQPSPLENPEANTALRHSRGLNTCRDRMRLLVSAFLTLKGSADGSIRGTARPAGEAIFTLDRLCW